MPPPEPLKSNRPLIKKSYTVLFWYGTRLPPNLKPCLPRIQETVSENPNVLSTRSVGPLRLNPIVNPVLKVICAGPLGLSEIIFIPRPFEVGNLRAVTACKLLLRCVLKRNSWMNLQETRLGEAIPAK